MEAAVVICLSAKYDVVEDQYLCVVVEISQTLDAKMRQLF
jgi:hypothetical protein